MKRPFSRKEFLKSTTALLAVALTGTSFDIKKKSPRLSFSTLGCPDWDFQKIMSFAADNGYSGIELRGIKRELDLTKCNEFKDAQNIASTISQMKEKGLKFVDLGSSANMHVADATERKKNLDEGRRFIDLAQQINCPNVRVYPNDFPKDKNGNDTSDLIIKGLLELGDYARASEVNVLMETHHELLRVADIERIMRSVDHPRVGLVWDICNMWTVTKESPAEMYGHLKRYIRHTHIKDAKMVNGTPQYVLLGQGEVPIFEAIDLLSKGGYQGYYSFEWEKLWHPELMEPEIVLADYPRAMKKHFRV
jgi:sugar phosphate isomerase/epimerase